MKGRRSCPLRIGQAVERLADGTVSGGPSCASKAIFDALHARKSEIEEAFGKALVWQRLDDKKACRIKYAKPFDGYNRENWPEMIDWLVEHIALAEKVFRPEVAKVKRKLQG